MNEVSCCSIGRGGAEGHRGGQDCIHYTTIVLVFIYKIIIINSNRRMIKLFFNIVCDFNITYIFTSLCNFVDLYAL